MKKYLVTLIFFVASITGCYSNRETFTHTRLQPYEIDEQIVPTKTTQKEILKTFGSRYTAEIDTTNREIWVYNIAIRMPGTMKHRYRKQQSFPIYNPQKNQVDETAYFPGKHPLEEIIEHDLKEYSLVVFFDEKGKVISHRLDPKDLNKTTAYKLPNVSFKP